MTEFSTNYLTSDSSLIFQRLDKKDITGSLIFILEIIWIWISKSTNQKYDETVLIKSCVFIRRLSNFWKRCWLSRYHYRSVSHWSNTSWIWYHQKIRYWFSTAHTHKYNSALSNASQCSETQINTIGWCQIRCSASHDYWIVFNVFPFSSVLV